jgi:hypothetical protein
MKEQSILRNLNDPFDLEALASLYHPSLQQRMAFLKHWQSTLGHDGAGPELREAQRMGEARNA